MMLLQQAGPGSLPLTSLSPDQFLDYLRKVEQLALDEKLSPVFVYWSSQNARRLLPAGTRHRELLRDAFCLSVFSEEQAEVPDEWCFLVESNALCLVVYGQQPEGAAGGTIFQCAGSLDPQIVRQAFSQMLPVWQFVDLSESNRLEDARSNLGPTGSAPHFVQRLKAEWPLVKPQAAEMPVFRVPSELAGAAEPAAGSAALHAAPQPGGPPLAPGGHMYVPGLASPTLSGALAGVCGAGGDGTAAADPGAAVDYVWGQDPEAPPAPAPAGPVQTAAAESRPAPAQLPAAEAPRLSIAPQVIPHAAQEIMRDIIGQLRHSNDLSSILQFAIERLTQVGEGHRGLIWQVVGDQLAVTNEYSITGHTCFVGNQLGSQESTAIVLEFLSRFPDESGLGVISIPDTWQDLKLHKMSPTLASLIELGDVRARLVAQLRCRGVFSGFLELQQCGQTRQWSEEVAAVVQHVANMLSVVVQQSFDQSKIESDAQELKLLNEIANLFRESKGQKLHDTLVKSVQLVAGHLGFIHAQIYLFNAEEGLLVPQIADAGSAAVDLSVRENPFVAVYESGRGQVINVEYTRKGDPYFKHDTALVVPLIVEGERLGVMGLWERLPNKAQLRQKDRDLALTIGGQLASIIRADQAIAQIREAQARTALINRVSSEIRQSPKEVDQILETLVQSLKEYFGLAQCVVCLYEGQSQDFTKSKTAGELADVADPLAPNMGEQLVLALLEELKQGKTSYLTGAEMQSTLAERNIHVPASVQLATLVPLVHAGNFKAALCMLSADRQKPFAEKDMKMVSDLADRVAVVVSHAELFAQVERQAVTDPMTGLYNRRHFNEQLSKEIDRFQRFGHPFSYVIVDLDYLKKINDTLGHQFGDAAIKHISHVLKRTTRDVDTAARYGGEEFVILLPVTDVGQARIAAERICAAIRENPVEGIGTITASVGVATFPGDADERDRLTELADQALYLAKHRGRNQVCSVSEDLMPSLRERGEEALEVQKEAIKKKAEEMASIDVKLIAEHGILGIMGAIIKIIEARDAYSKDRSPKAAEYASRLAHALHLPKEHITIISLAAVLHNVGKIALPEEILQKKGPLTPEERKIIEQSPVIGSKILEPAKHLHRVASVVESYHEHWDGSGYPKGLKGEDIPLESRIIALVDAYIAMTSDRPYRAALSHEEALRQIQEGAGKEWDPRLVKLFLSILQREAPTGRRLKQ